MKLRVELSNDEGVLLSYFHVPENQTVAMGLDLIDGAYLVSGISVRFEVDKTFLEEKRDESR